MSEWIEKPLGEITSYLAKGIPPKYTEEITEDTIYVLNQKCNRDFVISYGAARLHDSTKKKVAEEKMIQPGDVLINSTGEGTAGRVAQIWDLPYPTTIDGHMILIRPTDEVDSLYFGYAIKAYQSKIETLAEGSTGQTEINKKRLQDEIIICFPKDKDLQHRVAEVLENIDKKITVNNKINRNLSNQLETVFAERFLSLDWNGDLPEGWKLTKLKNVAQFSQGVQVPVEEQLSNYEEGYERFIRIVDITQGNEKDIRYIEDRQRGHVEENEIFMIRYGTPGILSWNYRGIIANNLFKISSTTEEVTYNYLYSLLKTERVLGYLKGNAVSSTMPAINFSTLNGVDILIPDKKTMQDFSEFSETIRIHQLELINENYFLTHLRNSLLPKLMNGEISVEDLDM